MLQPVLETRGDATDAARLEQVVGAVVATVAASAGAAPVASIIVAPARGCALTGAIAGAIGIARTAGLTVLIEGDARLARALGADGVHLSWCEEPMPLYFEAREILGTKGIVGADAGRSRHDAMTLGEAGADYVAFGIPAHVSDRDGARQRRLDLVGWWGEIFEIPSVASDIGLPEEAAALASAGADFVAARFPADLEASALPGWLAAYVVALAPPAATAS